MSNTYPAQPTFFRFGANLPIYVTRVNHYDVVFKAQNRTSQYMNYHTCIHARTHSHTHAQISANYVKFLQGSSDFCKARGSSGRHFYPGTSLKEQSWIYIYIQMSNTYIFLLSKPCCKTKRNSPRSQTPFIIYIIQYIHMYNWVNVLSIKSSPGSIFISKCPSTNQKIPVYCYLDFCGDQTEIVMTQSNVLCSHQKFV